MNAGNMRLGIDFPYVCERCLGPNPYVQMIKAEFGAKCRISNRPFHVFSWVNPASGRKIKTVICYEAASVRNCCQACMSDMTFGVPLVVRDALLKATGRAPAALPKSQVGQTYYFGQRNRESALAADGAVGIARRENPRKALEDAASELFSESVSNNRSVGSQGSQPAECQTTLWVAVSKNLHGTGVRLPDESALSSTFLQYGKINDIRRIEHRGYAFVVFDKHHEAKNAIQALGLKGRSNIAGVDIKIAWAKHSHKGKTGSSVKFGGNTTRCALAKGENKPQLPTSPEDIFTPAHHALHESNVTFPLPPKALRAFVTVDPSVSGSMYPLPSLQQARMLYSSIQNSEVVS